MKKTFSIFAVLLLIMMCCLPLLAYAHPGRTDGNGGHTDRDTGEYHYHHGYSAHDHWDMDGDGIKDCPYNFDDKTSHKNSGTSNSISSSLGQKNDPDTPIDDKEGETKVPSFIYWIIGILILVIIAMFQIIRRKDETIANNERTFKSREKDEEAKIKEEITSLHNALVAKYGEDYLYEISGAQEGDFIGEDGYPHSSAALTNAFADNYTFYLGGYSQNSNSKYHHRSCRYANSSFPINAMYLQNRRRYWPCMLCPCRLPDSSWVDKYKKHKAFIERYTDDE